MRIWRHAAIASLVKDFVHFHELCAYFMCSMSPSFFMCSMSFSCALCIFHELYAFFLWDVGLFPCKFCNPAATLHH